MKIISSACSIPLRMMVPLCSHLLSSLIRRSIMNYWYTSSSHVQSSLLLSSRAIQKVALKSARNSLNKKSRYTLVLTMSGSSNRYLLSNQLRMAWLRSRFHLYWKKCRILCQKFLLSFLSLLYRFRTDKNFSSSSSLSKPYFELVYSLNISMKLELMNAKQLTPISRNIPVQRSLSKLF